MELCNEGDELSLVFSLELHVKDLVRVICETRLICLENNLHGKFG